MLSDDEAQISGGVVNFSGSLTEQRHGYKPEDRIPGGEHPMGESELLMRRQPRMIFYLRSSERKAHRRCEVLTTQLSRDLLKDGAQDSEDTSPGHGEACE